MRRWLTRNLRLRLLAVSLAVLTWTAVVYAANPPGERTFAAHVPQDAASLPGHFVLLHSVPDLEVRVVGVRDHLDQFNTDSLQVSVQWSVVTQAGRQSIPVTVTTTDPSVKLDAPPTSITVDLDVLGTGTRTSRSSAVLPKLTGSVSLGRELAGVSVQPAAVLVTGPVNVLTTLTTISTDPVPLTGIDGNRTFSVKVALPAGVTTDQATVEVTVTVTTIASLTPQPNSTATPAPTP